MWAWEYQHIGDHLSLSLCLFSMIFGYIWCGVPEGCSKETKCMCTCCPWCFCRVLPSDTRLSPVCPHRSSRRTLEPLNRSPGWTIDVAAGCRARLQRQNRESHFCRYEGIGGTAVSRAGGGERWLRACQWSSFKWKKQLGLQQEVWVSTASRRLLRKHLHVKSSHSVKRHVTLLAFFLNACLVFTRTIGCCLPSIHCVLFFWSCFSKFQCIELNRSWRMRPSSKKAWSQDPDSEMKWSPKLERLDSVNLGWQICHLEITCWCWFWNILNHFDLLPQSAAVASTCLHH